MGTRPARAADAFRLSHEGETIVMEFGAGGTDGVQLHDRVLLPMEAGRRLLLWLDEALQPHVPGLRAAAAQALPPEQAAAAVRPRDPPLRPAPDEAAQAAARMMRLVTALGAPIRQERSFQLREGMLAANRFLLSLNPDRIAGDAAARVLSACAELGMPEAARAAAAAEFASAAAVHFGFEGAPGRIVSKLYLERPLPRDGGPIELHLAFKWDGGGGAVTSRYLLRPGLSAAAIRARLAAICGDGPAFDIAAATLDLAAGRIPAERLAFLEVSEDGTPRRSFDLNLYDAGLLVRDAQGLLQAMRAQFGIRPGQFQALYDQVRARPLGHIAGGLHRDGAPFFNIYHAVT